MAAGQEKTEKATPKKRRDAREKEGSVLQSKEINTAFAILGIFFALYIFAGRLMLPQTLNMMRFFMGLVGTDRLMTPEFTAEVAREIIFFAATIIGLLLACAVLAGTIPAVIQTKGLFTMQPLKPKFGKLNPITGAKRLFSLNSAVNVIKGLIIIAGISLVVYLRILSLMPTIMLLPDMTPMQGLIFIGRNIFFVVLSIIIIFAFVASLDYIYQWWQYEKKLKMSKQEVKDEYKQIEGDPQIKSRIKKKQYEIAQNRMMQEVPTSDVVIRNPTHYAIALRYDPDISPAPVVVAKGKGPIALKIIEIAREHSIHITEDKPLAHSMYHNLEVGGLLHPDFFTAIAIIFSEVESIQKKAEASQVINL